MKKGIIIALSIIISLVFLQSLPFKFTNSLETQHIFTTLAEWSGLGWFGIYGGYMVGGAELIAAIILFTPLRALGALMAVGIMSGAIFFHLFTPLGIVMPHFDAATGVQIGNDGGVLFMMACATWACALALVIIDMKQSDSTIKKLIGMT
ncbi:MAG: hypothetical protein ACJAUP_001486 [Cellvibrionaceae bacterium]|jgi:hypothetical protein